MGNFLVFNLASVLRCRMIAALFLHIRGSALNPASGNPYTSDWLFYADQITLRSLCTFSKASSTGFDQETREANLYCSSFADWFAFLYSKLDATVELVLGALLPTGKRRGALLRLKIVRARCERFSAFSFSCSCSNKANFEINRDVVGIEGLLVR